MSGIMALLYLSPQFKDHLHWHHLIAYAFLVLFLFSILRALFSPLRHLPGPFLARFTRGWYAYQMYRGGMPQTLPTLHKKYGPIVRIGPNEYSISDPEAVKTIYGHGSTFTKGRWYSTWMPPHMPASVFSTLDPIYHTTQRRKFANAFSVSSVVKYEPYIDQSTQLLLRLLDKAIDAGPSTSSAIVDFGKLMSYYTMDNIGAVTFGHRFGLLDNGQDKEGIIHELSNRTNYSAFVGLWPWAHKYIFPLLMWISPNGGHGFIAQFARAQMAEKERELEERRTRKAEGDVQGMDDGGPPDFMTKLLARHKQDPEAVTMFDLFTMCNTNIGAGSETTSIFISSVLYFLGGGGRDNGRSLAKLRKEIDDADQRGELSELVTWKESQKLQYYQYVVKEALRMHPVPANPLPRRATRDTLLAGQVFPRGTEVGISPWLLNFDTSIVGADAETWRPERWADEEASKRFERHSLVWGMGARNCLGKGIALLEGEKLIPQLIRRYDLELDDGLRERVEAGGSWATNARVFAKMSDFKVKVRRRERS